MKEDGKGRKGGKKRDFQIEELYEDESGTYVVKIGLEIAEN